MITNKSPVDYGVTPRYHIRTAYTPLTSLCLLRGESLVPLKACKCDLQGQRTAQRINAPEARHQASGVQLNRRNLNMVPNALRDSLL